MVAASKALQRVGCIGKEVVVRVPGRFREPWAVTFIPIPLPRKVLQTSCCTHLSFEDVLQTGLGMDMGMNGTAPARTLRSFKGFHMCVYIYIYIHTYVYVTYVYVYVCIIYVYTYDK